MRRSRLYRSIVVFGTALGAASAYAGLAAAIGAGCDLSDSGSHDGWHGIIDASRPDAACGGDAACPDAWHGIIDASVIDGNWGTIADAPTDGSQGQS